MTLLYKSISILINLIEILIVVRIVFSFLNIRRSTIFTSFVYQMTEPVLVPAQALLAKLKINTGMIDFSPMLAILFLRFANEIFARILL
ncbi:YggT family protein [Tissierella sp.]|uniref:YggT family protein n=1 Tax=Tissierella sp. TaxID=41274 RepID=UPI0028634C3F|nr:YggT family protein [Tissierella sp.]MDR7856406.1 YggT family protein [Tissierella sp.]